MNIIQKFEAKQAEELTANKKIPDFRPGDEVKVMVRISEGGNERNQAFQGICIARRNKGLSSSFTVRKISNGEGVERVFPTFSPVVASVELIRRGDVRRAKLYYMRELTGKSARIKERMENREVVNASDAPKVEKAAKEPKSVKAPKAEKAPKAKKSA